MAHVIGAKTINKTLTLFSNTSKEGIDDDITYGYDWEEEENHTVRMIIGTLAACIAIILCMVVFMVVYLWRRKKTSEKGAEAASRESREVNPGVESNRFKAAALDQGIQDFVREHLSRYEDLLAHNASRSPQVHQGEVPRWNTGAAASIPSSAGAVVPGGVNLPRVQMGANAPGGSSLQQMGAFAPSVGSPQVGAFAPSSGTSLQSGEMRAFAPNAPSQLRGPAGKIVPSWAIPQRGQVGTDAQAMTLPPAQLGLVYTKELRGANSMQGHIYTDELSKRNLLQQGHIYADELSKRQPGWIYTDELSKNLHRGQIYTDELSKNLHRGQIYTDESSRSPQRGQIYANTLNRSLQRGQMYTEELLGSSPLQSKIGTSVPIIPQRVLMGTRALGGSAQQRQSGAGAPRQGAGAPRQSADYAARVRHTGIHLPRDPWRKYESEPIYENTNLRRMQEHGYMTACRV